MMSSSNYQNGPGQGTLFQVKNKKHEKAPDWDGYIIADRTYQHGEQIKIAGWVKRGKWGELFSLKINNWKPGDTPAPAREVARADDDVPF
jgi:hypothetical protein